MLIEIGDFDICRALGPRAPVLFLLPVMILAMVLRCRLDLTYFDEGTCAHMPKSAIKLLL